MIDGKERVLNKRKYCLECSPFGLHNTTQLHIHQVNKVDLVTCKFCGKEYGFDRKKNNGRKICNSCRANMRRYGLKQELVAYKGGKCSICGYDQYLSALDFHHLDPSKKEIKISGNHSRSLDALKKEADKCILVCRNCHAGIHAEQDGTYERYGFPKIVSKD